MEVTDSPWQPLKGKAERRRKRPVYAVKSRNINRQRTASFRIYCRILSPHRDDPQCVEQFEDRFKGSKNLYKLKVQ